MTHLVDTFIAKLNTQLLDNSKLALVCCSDEWRGWVSNNSPKGESCTSTSSCNPLELTGNFLVTVRSRVGRVPNL